MTMVLFTQLLLIALSAVVTHSYSSYSAFTRSFSKPTPPLVQNGDATMFMYDQSGSNSNHKNNEHDMWTVLATTERWLSNILGKPSDDNPYTRKEVSYAFEDQDEDAMVIANIWRRLREARERGEMHGHSELDRRVEQGTKYTPTTFRQTQVIVLPNNEPLNSFKVFDHLVESINSARRSARDYVTDRSLQMLDAKREEESDLEWSVAVNCAHLHPNFGNKTREQIITELKAEEATADIQILAHKAKRLLARQSPYPTIVIETRCVPSPDFGQSPPPRAQENAAKEQVTSDMVSKLEAMFAMSAAHPDDPDDAFYNAIGNTMDEISMAHPMTLAQSWIAKHDNDLDILHSSFTCTDSEHVDAGYEFVFTNMAMHDPNVHRQYLVFSSLWSSSATSLEKFAEQVHNMIQYMPGFAGVEFFTWHPEHLDRSKQCPVPVLCMNWKPKYAE